MSNLLFVGYLKNAPSRLNTYKLTKDGEKKNERKKTHAQITFVK